MLVTNTRAFFKQLWLALGASLAFFIIGTVKGYSASAIPSLELHENHFISTLNRKSWIGAIPPLGAFTGSLCSGILMQKAGRRRTLQLTAPLWTSAWLLLSFAPSYSCILAGRVFCGLCVGLVIAPAQVYVSECSDPEIRGFLGSLTNLSMSFGILVSYIAGKWLYWRHLAMLSAGLCVIFFCILIPLPESPVWLHAEGINSSDAIAWLRLSPEAVADIKERSDMADEKPPLESEKVSLFSKKVFFSSVVLKPLIIVFTLLILQQFTGIDSVIFFTVEIFKDSGLYTYFNFKVFIVIPGVGCTLDATAGTIIVGAVQLIFNIISTVLVDRAGRKPLLIFSAAVMCLAMAAMGAAYYIETQNSWLGYLPVISLVVFMLGFSIGFGGIPFLLLGELFPAHHRSQLSSMAGAFSFLSMFTVVKTFHYLHHALTPAGTFWLYSGFCFLSLVFVVLLVPETKGKTLTEIEMFFKSNNKKNRSNGI